MTEDMPAVIQRAEDAYEAIRAINHLTYRTMPAPLAYWVLGNLKGVGQDWARSLRDQCQAAGVAFFFKQWGGRTPKAGGRELDGRTWDQYPQAVSA